MNHVCVHSKLAGIVSVHKWNCNCYVTSKPQCEFMITLKEGVWKKFTFPSVICWRERTVFRIKNAGKLKSFTDVVVKKHVVSLFRTKQAW